MSEYILKWSYIRHQTQYQRLLKKFRIPPWEKDVKSRLEIKTYWRRKDKQELSKSFLLNLRYTSSNVKEKIYLLKIVS